MTYSNNIEPRYIPGHPAFRDSYENAADDCLLTSRDLWLGHNVYYDEPEPEYAKAGCIIELFRNMMDSLESSPFFCCTYPIGFIGAYIICNMEIATVPMDVIGKRWKDQALAKNPKAMEYNTLAVQYLEDLNNSENIPERSQMITSNFQRKVKALQENQ